MSPARSSASQVPFRPSPIETARTLLEQVRTEGNAGRYAKAAVLARRGLRALENSPEEVEVRTLLMVNLASFTSILGRSQEAVELLDRAMEVDPDQRAVALSAKGLVLGNQGDFRGAVESFDEALVHRPRLDDRFRCTTLIRRGAFHLTMGHLPAATNDFVEADQLSRSGEFNVLAFMARQNLGWVRYLRGDLPGALAAMDDAQSVQADKPLGYPSLHQARVLMTAGLIAESRQFAERAVSEFATQRAPAEMVDGLLISCELDLVSGDGASASRNAAAAVSLGRRHRLGNVALIARTAALRARTAVRAAGGLRAPTRQEIDGARKLAARLVEAGLREDACGVHLAEAEMWLARGRLDEARAAVRSSGRLVRRPALATRLHARSITGRIAFADDDRRAGLTALRSGLDDLADSQARFGSQDMQAGVSVHGQELARLGLRTAVGTREPAVILQWLERSRAASTRLPAVHPPADPELAEMLGALRAASVEAREAALAGRRDPAGAQRVIQLRQQIRARSWLLAGSGAVVRPLTLTAVQRLLAADPADPTVVAYITGQHGVRALIINARQATFRTLGEWTEDSPAHRRRAADLDMLAAPRVPARIRAVARTSVGREFDRLSADLVDPIADRLASGPVIIAVTGELATVPWNLLPALDGRAVSVCSSVTSAMASAGRPAGAHLRGVLAVAGPDVDNGAKEAHAVAALHPGAGLLVDEAANGAAVLAQIPAGGLLHVAAHGHHETQSPMFSSVLLADGPLYGYDIAPNPTLPDQVVLSSCDVGRSDVRPGGEPLGLAAALLRSGVSTVVAGVCRISDAVASTVMAGYHQNLLAGASPAQALAAATRAVEGEYAAFNCFGAGA